jgi:hypothetical protein
VSSGKDETDRRAMRLVLTFLIVSCILGLLKRGWKQNTEIDRLMDLGSSVALRHCDDPKAEELLKLIEEIENED